LDTGNQIFLSDSADLSNSSGPVTPHSVGKAEVDLEVDIPRYASSTALHTSMTFLDILWIY